MFNRKWSHWNNLWQCPCCLSLIRATAYLFWSSQSRGNLVRRGHDDLSQSDHVSQPRMPKVQISRSTLLEQRVRDLSASNSSSLIRVESMYIHSSPLASINLLLLTSYLIPCLKLKSRMELISQSFPTSQTWLRRQSQTMFMLSTPAVMFFIFLWYGRN